MPGFNQQQLNYNVLNANQVVLTVGDIVIGFAQTAPHTIDFGTESLYGVGEATPQEIQQLRIAPTITIEHLALTTHGVTLLTGGQKLAYILANTQFNIHIVDSQSEQVMFTYVDAVCQTFSETLASNRPIVDTMVFQAMDVLAPDGNSILASNSFLAPGNFVTAAFSQTGLGIAVPGG